LGGLDVYKVIFNDVDEPITVVKGKITLTDETGTHDWKSDNQMLDISVYDAKQNLFGKYIYNNNLGRFIATLPSGEFKLMIQANGYQDYSESISIMERNLYQPEIEKIFSLSPKK